MIGAKAQKKRKEQFSASLAAISVSPDSSGLAVGF